MSRASTTSNANECTVILQDGFYAGEQKGSVF